MKVLKSIGSAIGGWLGVKSLSTDVGGWLQGQDVDSNSEGAKLVTPYAQSGWLYVAISTLAENVAQIPFRICRVAAEAQKELRGFTAARAAGRSYTARQRALLNDNEVESGPIVDLFKRPHPTMDRNLFWRSVITWDCLRGEFFVMPLDGQDNPVDLSIVEGRASRVERPSQVQRMLTVSPDLLWHIVQGYELMGWRYTGSPLMSPLPSQVLLPTEVIHSRSPNPNGFYWRGMSPISLAMLPASSDFAAGQFMKGLMMNNADTGVIVTTDQQASPEQREAILSALRERKRKAGTPDRPLFLWGGSKLEKPTVSSADGQFLEHRNANREEIFAIIKVPLSMAGIQSQKGRSLGGGGEMEQDKLNFIEGRLTPLCRNLETALAPIVASFGLDLVGYFDVDDLPILQNARRARLDAGTKAFAMGYPPNMINRVYDLGFEELPWGDVGWLPFNLQSAESVMNPPEPTTATPGPDGKPSNGKPKPGEKPKPTDPVTDALRLIEGIKSRATESAGKPEPNVGLARTPNASRDSGHICKANPEYEAFLKPREKMLQSKMKRFWFEQKGRILGKLPDVMKEFERTELNAEAAEDGGENAEKKYRWLWAAISKTSRGLDELFDSVSEDGKLTKALKSVLFSDLQDGGSQLYGEIGQDNFSLAPKDAIAFLDKRKVAINGMNQTTWDKLKESLQEGLQEGDSMSKLEDRVRVFFAGQDGRAEVIATTETNIAINSGRDVAMKEAGVTRKGWQTSHLENTRATHAENEALSNAENGIPIEDEWPNGCRFPGDPDGDVGEVINCRCFGYAVLEDKSP